MKILRNLYYFSILRFSLLLNLIYYLLLFIIMNIRYLRSREINEEAILEIEDR